MSIGNGGNHKNGYRKDADSIHKKSSYYKFIKYIREKSVKYTGLFRPINNQTENKDGKMRVRLENEDVKV